MRLLPSGSDFALHVFVVHKWLNVIPNLGAYPQPLTNTVVFWGWIWLNDPTNSHSSARHMTGGFRHVKGYVASWVGRNTGGLSFLHAHTQYTYTHSTHTHTVYTHTRLPWSTGDCAWNHGASGAVVFSCCFCFRIFGAVAQLPSASTLTMLTFWCLIWASQRPQSIQLQRWHGVCPSPWDAPKAVGWDRVGCSCALFSACLVLPGTNQAWSLKIPGVK